MFSTVCEGILLTDEAFSSYFAKQGVLRFLFNETMDPYSECTQLWIIGLNSKITAMCAL
jgi:hypothetical protein